MALTYNTVNEPHCAVEFAEDAMVSSLRGSRADLTLEVLMRQALEVPGAASALLEAFAAQSRALRLVQEADARGAASLPDELRDRLAAVVQRTPSWLAARS